ncbi:MAG: hypothetical protein GY863_13610 [bacterium]|nr:hypothetical protein [bacterium]
MNKYNSFHSLFFVFYCPALLIAVLVFILTGSYGNLASFAWGNSVSIVLIYGSAIAASRVMLKSIPWFLGIVLGGIIIRMIIVVAVSIIVVKMTEFHLISFFGGLFGSFVLLQILDMIYIQKQFRKREAETDERTE